MRSLAYSFAEKTQEKQKNCGVFFFFLFAGGFEEKERRKEKWYVITYELVLTVKFLVYGRIKEMRRKED